MTKTAEELRQEAVSLTQQVVETAMTSILIKIGERYDQKFVRVRPFFRNCFGFSDVTVFYGSRMQYFVQGRAYIEGTNEGWTVVTVDLSGSAELHIEGGPSRLLLGLLEWSVTEKK